LVTPPAPAAVGAPVANSAAITELPLTVVAAPALDVTVPLVTQDAIPPAGDAFPSSPPSAGSASVLPVPGSIATLRTILPVLNVAMISPAAILVAPIALDPASVALAGSSAIEDFRSYLYIQ
jgi:hypothetical protein